MPIYENKFGKFNLGKIMTNYHLTKKTEGWVLRKENSTTNLVQEDTKEDAILSMRLYMVSKIGSVKIHKLDGTIEEERTYPRSQDPSISIG